MSKERKTRHAGSGPAHPIFIQSARKPSQQSRCLGELSVLVERFDLGRGMLVIWAGSHADSAADLQIGSVAGCAIAADLGIGRDGMRVLFAIWVRHDELVAFDADNFAVVRLAMRFRLARGV